MPGAGIELATSTSLEPTNPLSHLGLAVRRFNFLPVPVVVFLIQFRFQLSLILGLCR